MRHHTVKTVNQQRIKSITTIRIYSSENTFQHKNIFEFKILFL